MDDLIGQFMDYLAGRKLENCVNLVVVADHGKALNYKVRLAHMVGWAHLSFWALPGMEEVDCSNVVDLSQYLDTSEFAVYDGVQGRLSSSYTYTPDGEVTEKDGGNLGFWISTLDREEQF